MNVGELRRTMSRRVDDMLAPLASHRNQPMHTPLLPHPSTNALAFSNMLLRGSVRVQCDWLRVCLKL